MWHLSINITAIFGDKTPLIFYLCYLSGKLQKYIYLEFSFGQATAAPIAWTIIIYPFCTRWIMAVKNDILTIYYGNYFSLQWTRKLTQEKIKLNIKCNVFIDNFIIEWSLIIDIMVRDFADSLKIVWSWWEYYSIARLNKVGVIYKIGNKSRGRGVKFMDSRTQNSSFSTWASFILRRIKF